MTTVTPEITPVTANVTAPLTCRLNDGTEVLAKFYHGDLYPVTYANRTQAERKLAQLGGGWWIRKGMSRPFYLAKEAK